MRPRRGLLVAVACVLVLGAGGLVLLASPRHRPSIRGLGDILGAPSSLPGVVGGSASGPAAAKPVAVLTTKVRAPTADAEGRVRVPIADALPPRLPAEGVPLGWDLKQFAGQSSIELVRDEGRLAVRLRSERASFALYRDVVVDLKHAPMLSWSWKVIKLPAAGDVREPGRNDQAVQVYVIFPRWPSPRIHSDVVGYVWDSRAPVGTRMTNAKADNVRIIVLESGLSARDGWRQQRRNVAEDYEALFGRRAPRVGKVAVMIDSDDTRADAESLVTDLIFSPASLPRVEIPTAVLRYRE
jgi:hypothetical protein